VRPVRIVSPGLRLSSCFNEACWTSEVAIHTSPEDLLTDQLPPSAAKACEEAIKTKAVATTVREIPGTKRMARPLLKMSLGFKGKVSTLSSQKGRDPGVPLTVN
jgi:hypothetical protein